MLIQTLAATLQAGAPGGTGATPGASQPGWVGLIGYTPFLLVIGVMYFMLIAPARKQRQRTQAMLDALKTGDKVVTSGGLIGTIVRVNADDNTLKLRIAPSVEVEVTRGAVAGLQAEPQAGP